MRAILIAALAALCVGGAHARSRHHAAADVSGKFDYYVMSLSWSPTFCESHKSNQQCGQHLGFVLHGLWPQYQAGGYPQQCATPERLTEAARAYAVENRLFPTEDLLAHEWQTHGTCNGSSALDYFKAAQSAHASIQVPAQLAPGDRRKSLTGREISKLIRDANPAITAKSMVVQCAGKELSEVRVCLSKDLAPRPCGSKVNDGCGTGLVKVPGAE